MTDEERERRRYALLNAAAILLSSPEFRGYEKTVDAAEMLLSVIERRERDAKRRAEHKKG